MKRVFRALTASVALWMVVIGVAIAAPTKSADKSAPVKASESAVVESSLSGKVVETMDAGGYTYVCLEKNGAKTWVAVPQMKVSVGQQMAFNPGAPMANFTSKSLKRTFPMIYFSGGPIEAGSHMGGSSAAAKSDRKSSPSRAKNVKVAKATGPNAYTIAEIFAGRKKLNNKKVVVRGTVVKVSTGIMNKNWLHLEDGTGDPDKGTHDLVVTTKDTAAVGDVVVVKGTVVKDKDFGSGYKYVVMIEQASVQR